MNAYVVIIEGSMCEDVYVFTSREKAWEFINGQEDGYTLMNAELVE